MFDGPVEGVCTFYSYRCVGGRGEDVEFSHGFGGGFELGAYAFFGAAAFEHVAVDASGEADVVWGVDVDGEVVEGDEIGVVEGEDAFDDDDGGWGDGIEVVGDAGVGGEVVDGALDGLSAGEGADVLDDEFGLERVGVVEVALVAGVEGELGEIAVVEVEWEERGVELGGEFAGEGGLAGAGTACNADDERVVRQRELNG